MPINVGIEPKALTVKNVLQLPASSLALHKALYPDGAKIGAMGLRSLLGAEMSSLQAPRADTSCPVLSSVSAPGKRGMLPRLMGPRATPLQQAESRAVASGRRVVSPADGTRQNGCGSALA